MTKTDWVVSKTLRVITFTFFNVFFQNRKKRDFLRFFCFVAYVFSNNELNVNIRRQFFLQQCTTWSFYAAILDVIIMMNKGVYIKRMSGT